MRTIVLTVLLFFGCFVGTARGQTGTIPLTVTSTPTNIVVNVPCTYVVIQENTATPTNAFTIKLPGNANGVTYAAGNRFIFSAAPGGFNPGQVIGTIAIASSTTTFVGIESISSPTVPAAVTLVDGITAPQPLSFLDTASVTWAIVNGTVQATSTGGGGGAVASVTGTTNQVVCSPTTGAVICGFAAAPILPNGTTATTQTTGDTTTKVATDQFVLANAGALPGGTLGQLQDNAGSSTLGASKTVVAAAFAGTTCGDKINAAITAIGPSAHILIDSGCPQGSAASPSTAVTSSVAGIVIDFWQPGTWYFRTITLSGQASGIMALPCAENNITSLSDSCPTILYMGNGINPTNFVTLSGGQTFIHDVTLYGNKTNNGSIPTVGLLMTGNRSEAARVQVQNFHGDGIYINGSPAPAGSSGCDGITTCVAEGANLTHVQSALNDSNGWEVLNQPDVFAHFSKFEDNTGWGVKATNATVFVDEFGDFGGNTLGGADGITTSANFNVWTALIFNGITIGNNAGPAVFQSGWNGTTIANGPTSIENSSIVNGAGLGTSADLIHLEDVTGVIVSGDTVQCVSASNCRYGISIINNATTGSTAQIINNVVTGNFTNTNSAALGNNIPLNLATTATVTFALNNENGASQNSLTNARLLSNGFLYCTNTSATIENCLGLNSGNHLEILGDAAGNRIDLSPDRTTLLGFTNTESIFPNAWQACWQNASAAVNGCETLNASNDFIVNNGNSTRGIYLQINAVNAFHVTNALASVDGLPLSLGNLIADPMSPSPGWTWYNTSLNKFRCDENGTVANCINSVPPTIATNGTNNAVQTTLNFITSSTNSLGMVITPFNPATTGNERFEFTGTPTGTWNFGGATFEAPQGSGFVSTSTNTIGIDTAAPMLHAYLGADTLIPFVQTPGSWVNGHCPVIYKSGSQYGIADNGASCGSGGASIFTSYQFGSQTAITGTANYLQTTYPSIFVTTQTGAGSSGSPFIDAITLATQSANTVFAGPTSGGAAIPTFQTAPTISAANMTNFPTFNQNTTGIAATATASQNTPTLCSTNSAPTGITATFNATGCTVYALATLADLSSVAVNLALTPGTDASISLDSLTKRYVSGWFSSVLGWTNGSGTADTGLSRGSADTVDCGNGTAADVTCTLNLGTLATSGSNGGITLSEGTCAGLTPATSVDTICGDSTAHRAKFNPNNAGYDYFVGIASAGAANNCPKFAANGYDLVDSGAGCGGLSGLTTNCLLKASSATSAGCSTGSDNGSQVTFTAPIAAGTGTTGLVSTVGANQNIEIGSGNGSGSDGGTGIVTIFKPVLSGTIATVTNCASAASPAVCGSASAGRVALPTGTNPTLTVNTSAVTANSEFIFGVDESLGTALGVTCNTTLSTLLTPVVTTRSVGVSFTFTIGAVIAVNPACVSYTIFN